MASFLVVVAYLTQLADSEIAKQPEASFASNTSISYQMKRRSSFS